MTILRFVLFVSALAVLSAGAAVPAFEKGDRVAFVGDSITHGGSYHPNIYLFYATRFPDAPFKVYNCGISGDTAPGTNIRFEKDIAIHRPNRATIMLGMNDAWAWLFAEPDNPGREAGLKNAYELYTTEMDQLAASLKAIGADIIFIKPSIYDQTVELKKQNLVGKNDLLKKFAGFIDDLAVKYDGTTVDFYSLMMDVNAKLQAEDPTATIVGGDRVHPGAKGHLVMSYAFLKAQAMPTLVSSIAIDAGAGKVIGQANCTIESGAKISTEQISFNCLENALPFPVGDDQKTALSWVPFQQELNQQILKVSHLKSGTYELNIDGQSVGSYSSDELAEGINLSDNRLTPQYQQALKVKRVNAARLEIVSKLRAIMHVRHTIISKLDPPVDATNLSALKPALEAHVEKSNGESWHGYVKMQAEEYLKSVPHEAAYRAEAEALMEEIWTVNQPRPHKWSITPVTEK